MVCNAFIDEIYILHVYVGGTFHLYLDKLTKLPYFLCNGRTIMSTVVHQDECIQS